MTRARNRKAPPPRPAEAPVGRSATERCRSAPWPRPRAAHAPRRPGRARPARAVRLTQGFHIGARAQPPFQCDGGDIFVHVPLRMTEAVLDVPLEAPRPEWCERRCPRSAGQPDGRPIPPCVASAFWCCSFCFLEERCIFCAGTPSGVPRCASHAPGPIAASVLPAPVLVEVADASIAPAAAPAPGPPALEADRGGPR